MMNSKVFIIVMMGAASGAAALDAARPEIVCGPDPKDCAR